MRNRVVLIVSVLFITATATAAVAVDPDLVRAEIHISHKNLKYIASTFGAQQREFRPTRLEAKIATPFDLKPGETVVIYVDDPNPFFYKYEWVVGGSSLSSNAQVAQEFSGNLLSLINGLEPPKASGGAAAFPAPSSTTEAFRSGLAYAAFLQSPGSFAIQVSPESSMSSVEILSTAAERLQAIPTPSSPAAADSQARGQTIIDNAVGWVRTKAAPQARSDVIKKILRNAGVPNSEAFLQGFKASVAELFLLNAQVKPLLEQIDAGIPDATAPRDAPNPGDVAKDIVAHWPLDSVGKEIADDYDKMRKVGEALQAVLSSDSQLKAAQQLQELDFGAVGFKEASANLKAQIDLNKRAQDETSASISLLELCADQLLNGNRKPEEQLDELHALDEKMKRWSKQKWDKLAATHPGTLESYLKTQALQAFEWVSEAG